MLPENDSPVTFFAEDIDFELKSAEAVLAWLQQIGASEGSDIEELSYVFCSDSYLLEMNQQYLKHDTYTDVITFDYAEEEGIVEGDIFISVDRVKENAASLQVKFPDELHRVMVHGLLHLLGYSDKTEADQKEMREKEDYYLSLRPFSGKDL